MSSISSSSAAFVCPKAPSFPLLGLTDVPSLPGRPRPPTRGPGWTWRPCDSHAGTKPLAHLARHGSLGPSGSSRYLRGPGSFAEGRGGPSCCVGEGSGSRKDGPPSQRRVWGRKTCESCAVEETLGLGRPPGSTLPSCHCQRPHCMSAFPWPRVRARSPAGLLFSGPTLWSRCCLYHVPRT